MDEKANVGNSSISRSEAGEPIETPSESQSAENAATSRFQDEHFQITGGSPRKELSAPSADDPNSDSLVQRHDTDLSAQWKEQAKALDKRIDDPKCTDPPLNTNEKFLRQQIDDEIAERNPGKVAAALDKLMKLSPESADKVLKNVAADLRSIGVVASYGRTSAGKPELSVNYDSNPNQVWDTSMKITPDGIVSSVGIPILPGFE